MRLYSMPAQALSLYKSRITMVTFVKFLLLDARHPSWPEREFGPNLHTNEYWVIDNKNLVANLLVQIEEAANNFFLALF